MSACLRILPEVALAPERRRRTEEHGGRKDGRMSSTPEVQTLLLSVEPISTARDRATAALTDNDGND